MTKQTEVESRVGMREALGGRDCACFNLRRTTRLVTQMYDEILRPSGLRGTQFTLLMALRSRGRVSMNELADAVVMDRTTLSRNLRPLERDGLIRVEPGADQRVREVTLTAKGQRALDRAYPLWKQAQASMRKLLGAPRLANLLTDLRDAVDGIRS